jgi:hypothetical protein
VDKALSGVIGQRGCAALFQRSLHLASSDYPWLGAAYSGAAESGAFGALRSVLAQQTPEQAAAAHDSLLQTFLDLLADLIGESLTRRLLQAAWDSSSSGHAVPRTHPHE